MILAHIEAEFPKLPKKAQVAIKDYIEANFNPDIHTNIDAILASVVVVDNDEYKTYIDTYDKITTTTSDKVVVFDPSTYYPSNRESYAVSNMQHTIQHILKENGEGIIPQYVLNKITDALIDYIN